MRHTRPRLSLACVSQPGLHAALTVHGMLRGAWHGLRVGFAAASFVGFGVGAFLLGVVVLPLVSAATRGRDERLRRCQRIVQRAFRLFHDFMRVVGLVDFQPRVGPRLPDRPVVLVANHPTLVDVTALVALFGPLCYLAKRSLFRNPLIGPLLYFCGQIPGGGRTLHENLSVMDDALDRLARGHSLLLFPEGTRSPPGELLKFHSGAFEIARRAGVPLVPLLLRAEPPALYRGLAWYQIPRQPIRMQVEALPQVDPQSARDARELGRQVEAAIRLRL
jgi:1-acyl-sn-glycerol-3-phosphate acyltransferase